MAKIIPAYPLEMPTVRKPDRPSAAALPGRANRAGRARTEVAALDACLRHGIPSGRLSELAGPRSSGRTTLMLRLLAAAARRGELVALIDTFDRLDVASAVAAGVDLDRCLWVRGQALSKTAAAVDARWTPGTGMTGTSHGEGGLLERTIDRALKAATLVLQAGVFGTVVLDLADVPAVTLAQMPFTTWLRLQRTIEGRETACLLVAPAPLVRGAGGLTLSLAGRIDIQERFVPPHHRVAGTVRVSAAVARSA